MKPGGTRQEAEYHANEGIYTRSQTIPRYKRLGSAGELEVL